MQLPLIPKVESDTQKDRGFSREFSSLSLKLKLYYQIRRKTEVSPAYLIIDLEF